MKAINLRGVPEICHLCMTVFHVERHFDMWRSYIGKDGKRQCMSS